MPSLAGLHGLTFNGPGTSVPGYYYAVPPGLVAASPLNFVDGTVIVLMPVDVRYLAHV